MELPEGIANAKLSDADSELLHYGVKGQKWGVRKAGSGKIRARSTMSRRDRKDQKWMETAQTEAYDKVYRRAAGKIRKGTRQINRKPEYKGQSFRRDTPLRRQYYGEYSKMVSDQLNAASAKHGISPKKRFQMHFEFDVNKDATPQVSIRRTEGIIGRSYQREAARETRRLKHAEDDFLDEVEVELIYDEDGYILDMEMPSVTQDEDLDQEDFLEHYDFDHAEFAAQFGDEDLDDFLELKHFGVKGMKWGVRKGAKSATVTVKNSASGKSAEISYNPRKTTVNSQTGEITTSSKKELKSIQSQVQKNKLKLMSDEDLKKRIGRLKMEQEYKKLTAEQESPGKKLVKKIIADTGNELAKSLVTNVLVPGISGKAGAAVKQASLIREAQKAASSVRTS